MNSFRRRIRSAAVRKFAVIAATVVVLKVFGVRADPPPMVFAFVPATDSQVGGPGYDFRISRYEIRNDQFAAFLNDALANLDHPRGRYLYFDLDSGDVHIHSELAGQTGVNGTGPLLFDADANGRIAYLDGQYIVPEPSFALHPVTGVTWYGAVKFCNWLTLIAGLEESELAYAEAPASELSGWRPNTITNADWAVRDLTDAERDALLQKRGFRLPMDGGADGAAAYNEWFKAASARRDQSGMLFFDALYGFGREEPPTPPDANYFASGDPFEPGTTPVGFYNGVNFLPDGTAAHDTDNAYGLYDLSGNVWEWLQDQSPSDPTRRRNRGGSWQSAAASLKLVPGAHRAASSAVSSTGFRIVQRVPDAIMVTPQADFVAAGPWGGPYVPPPADPLVYRLTNLVHQPIDFTSATQQPWLTVTPGAGSIPIGDFAEVSVSIAPACADILPSGENVAALRFSFGAEPKTIERSIRLTLSEPLTLIPAEGLEAEMLFGGTPTPTGLMYTLESASDGSVEWSASWEDVSEPLSGAAWLTINGGPSAIGEVAPHATADAAVTIDPVAAATLPAGVHEGEVTFRDECTGEEFIRTVTLRVTAPLSVTPVEESISTGVFGGPFHPAAHAFSLTNVTGTALDWTAALCVDAETCAPPPEPHWPSLETAAGALAAGDHVDVSLTLTSEAESLGVGRHSLFVRFVTGSFTADRTVTVEVTGLRLDPSDDGELHGPLGGPFEPESMLYTLHNGGLEEMFWTATVVYEPIFPMNWVNVTPSKGTVLDPEGAADITVSPSPDAAALPTGIYVADVIIDSNGATASRRITLSVSGDVFSVTPSTDFETAGRAPDTITPAYAVYRMANIAGQGAGAIYWHVSTNQSWVMLNGGPTTSGSLSEGASVNLIVAIDPAAAPQLAPDVSEQRFDAVITFDDLTHALTTNRHFSLILVAPRFDVNDSLVSSKISQPAGPDYSFQMGRFHVTNSEFVAFLNDALANPEHLRGQYMYFHTTTGDVYLNTEATGQIGEDLGALTVKVFSPAASGQITLIKGQYEVITEPVDYSTHPVTAVSWYGAVKFCNWLTLDQGMPPLARCYAEVADPQAWRPVSIGAANWLTRDLTDEEHEALVKSCRGFRLPMDDGYNNPTPTIDSADDYNEWYKAAAWNDALQQNTLFGFGRGTLTGGDANFRCSGDGFENAVNCASGGTTPVGYYDGTVQAGSFATNSNNNTFGLFDMAGNVHQWLQGRYAPSNTIDRRTLRGGSWNDDALRLRTTSRAIFATPDSTSNQIGFRVLRTLAPSNADFDADGDVDLFDFASLVSCATGPGGDFTSLCSGFDFDHDADVDLRDLAEFLNAFAAPPLAE